MKYPFIPRIVINFVFGLTVFVERITIIVAWRGSRWQLLTSSYDKREKQNFINGATEKINKQAI
jgi:hypothetical protein